MRLKEIKPGMAVKCKTKEEAIALWMWFYENGYVRKEYPEDGLDNFIDCFSCSLFYIRESINSWGTFSEGIADVKKVEFSDLIIPELSAEELLQIINDICNTYSNCSYDCKKECPFFNGYCKEWMAKHSKETVEICAKWKSDHEKKEPEIETVDICRIIEILPNGFKRCVHEEDIEADPELPYGGEQLAVEQILKRYCMEHDGEYIAVHEVVSRVKAV